VLSQYEENQIQDIINDFSALKLKILQTQPNGIYNAQNLGLINVKTKFTLILNGGDSLTSVEAVGNLLSKIGNKSWGFGRMEIVDPAQGTKSTYSFRKYSRARHRLGIKYVPHPASIVNAQLARSYGGFDENLQVAADQKLLLTFASHSSPATTDEVIATFYRGGVSSRGADEIVSDFQAISREIYGHFFKSTFLDTIIWKIVLIVRKIKQSY